MVVHRWSLGDAKIFGARLQRHVLFVRGLVDVNGKCLSQSRVPYLGALVPIHVGYEYAQQQKMLVRFDG